MNNMLTKIGFAEHFHSRLDISERLQPESKLEIISFAQWSDDICLFVLPNHLQKKWWSEAVRELLPNVHASAQFEEFMQAFKDFANYKSIPLVEHHQFEILIRVAGHSENKRHNQQLCAVVNLGDASTSVSIGNEFIALEPCDGCWIPPNVCLQLNPIQNDEKLDVLLQIWRVVTEK